MIPSLPLVSWRFQEGDVRLQVLSAACLDDLIRDDRDLERPPYWAVCWPSGIALARRLAGTPSLLPAPSPPAGSSFPTLELGCGAGLPGLAAARLGVRVLQSDCSVDALSLARWNARRNRVAGVEQLAADWRAWPLRARFPLVLAADVLYERALHAALFQVLEGSLAPGGRALIADPGRPPALDFFANLEALGWNVAMDEVFPSPDAVPVFLFTLAAPAPTAASSR